MFWPQRMSGAEMGLLRDFPGSQGLVPGQGTKIPHAAWYGLKKKKKRKKQIQSWVSFVPAFLKAARLLSWWMD